MISILIPTYNEDCTELILKLHSQASALKLPFEILVSDDASPTPLPALTDLESQLEFFVYKKQLNNLGRAANRNYLASQASYEHLLFIDGDSSIVKDDYLSKFIDTSTNSAVVYGGTIYQEHPTPIGSRLRWLYGQARESTGAIDRTRQPYIAFKTNNFMIPRHIMLALPFDEDIKEYGHEDTVFAIELEKENIPIVHLDAALLHTGIEEDELFLAKSRQALETLHNLYVQPKYRAGLIKHHRLVRKTLQLRKFGFGPLLGKALVKWYPFMLRKSSGPAPSLFWFDLYRLSYFMGLGNAI